MRIIAGEFKGRSLEVGEGTRPTADFVRQALFSMLGGTIEGTFLDLYAGSGAVGLEARSRGAHAILVEREPVALKAIRANIDHLDVKSGLSVVAGDVLKFLKSPESSRPAIEPRPVEYVFADPPYDYPLEAKLLRLLAATPLVGPGTLVILERRGRAKFNAPEGLELLRETQHGEARLAFMRRPGSGAGDLTSASPGEASPTIGPA